MNIINIKSSIFVFLSSSFILLDIATDPVSIFEIADKVGLIGVLFWFSFTLSKKLDTIMKNFEKQITEIRNTYKQEEREIREQYRADIKDMQASFKEDLNNILETFKTK